jgi:HK97 gp10 family phage protein
MAMRLEGGDRFRKHLRGMAKDVNSGLEAAVVAGAFLVRNSASEKAPYKTGNLRSSIHVEPKSSGKDEAIAEVGTSEEYARIQEYGGTITAKNKPYLVFRTEDGKWHSVKSVTIPPHPYLRPAFDENKARVKSEIERAVKKLL